MRGTFALFASVGAGVSLVAAAALSLLTVSAVVAIGGWPGLGITSTARPLVVVAARVAPVKTAPVAVVMPKPVVRPRLRPVVLAVPKPTKVRPVKSFVAAVTPRIISEPASSANPNPARLKPNALPTSAVPAAGNGVRKIGDGLSSTLQKAGKGLTDATAPLSPPLAQTIDKVAQLVAALIKNATQGVGGTLDHITRPRHH